MIEKLSYEERRAISRMVQKRHGVFYQFWELVAPCWDDTQPTACVGIDKENNNLSFSINKKFWDSCSDYQKEFIVCHEAYHLINQHGSRANGQFDEAKNIALDIPINEGLVKYFDFDRSKLDMEDFCWLDKVFPDGEAEPDRSFEYYYDILKQNGRLISMPKYCGNHDGLPKNKQEQDFLNKLIENLDEHSANELKDILKRQQLIEQNSQDKNSTTPDGNGRGEGTAGIIAKIEKRFVPKKKKWETIIRKFTRIKTIKDLDVHHWITRDRRLAMFPQSFMLPNDLEINDRDKEKKKSSIFVFLDVSGSCWGMKDRFYKAFESIPKNIAVKLFSFDDVAYELNTKERKIIGGGGTSFTCIEKKIQEVIKRENLLYPQSVFVLTDGMADKVKPEKPKNWIFLLTTDYQYCIPPESKRFDLREFE